MRLVSFSKLFLVKLLSERGGATATGLFKFFTGKTVQGLIEL